MRFLFLGLLLLTSCAELGARILIHPIRQPVLRQPEYTYESLTVVSGEATLHGWVIRPPHRTPRGLIVFLHGLDSNRVFGMKAITTFVPRGYEVVLYDQRAHGTSGGNFTTYGALEAGDLSRVLDQVQTGPVTVMGHSLGAAVAMEAAAKDLRIRAVVAASCFSDLLTEVHENVPGFLADYEAQAIHEAEDEAHFHFADISPMTSAASVHVPVMLIHGTDDTLTKPAHSERIFAALTSSKRLVQVVGAHHNDVLDDDALWHDIAEWVDQLAP